MKIELLAQNIVKELVSSGALEQAVKRATGATTTPVTSNATLHPTSNNDFSPEQKLRFSLRGDCMNLVEKIVEKHGIDKKIIFGELKKRTGVSQPEASPEQLSERVDLLQAWLETGRL
jgi:hypothetical protein